MTDTDIALIACVLLIATGFVMILARIVKADAYDRSRGDDIGQR